MRTSRLEAFSDGVLAIIITIMVLELKEPSGLRPSLAELSHSFPGLLSYLLSFIYVGIYWANHHHMFQVTEHVTGGVLWANLGLLFCLSLFPFTTQWMDSSTFARTPVIVYGVNLLVAAIAYYILQTVIIRSQGEDSALRKAIGRDWKGKVSPIGYIAGITAALAGGAGTILNNPGIAVAVACYVAMAAIWVIPDRRIEAVVISPATTPADPEQHS
jgi:TMEM175 potassium channel family protein